MSKINIEEKFSLFSELWSPKIIAESNEQLVKIAKGRGELVWHKHDNEDELFLVFKGQLTLQMRETEIVLNPGEMYVVAKGVEHCPRATEETHFLMVEPKSTAHTGSVVSELTVDTVDQAWI
ncbi:mannose-6-phosphate isomerase [Shewanella sairae]|uniref:Mannose-6-phosphate isomerase n=1 Tax=Shewanella sairae TaxID=190310 RepID=A0ABQ4PH52_9GAMM|nr:cupin domain-containing protein [Shewanella sairae]MCL1131241.1 cupin domain-containing protein [Shewanella sairae]GIU46851.1 mannose-6-phosphate isomerase [Shewanella sairae]